MLGNHGSVAYGGGGYRTVAPSRTRAGLIARCTKPPSLAPSLPSSLPRQVLLLLPLSARFIALSATIGDLYRCGQWRSRWRGVCGCQSVTSRRAFVRNPNAESGRALFQRLNGNSVAVVRERHGVEPHTQTALPAPRSSGTDGGERSQSAITFKSYF